MKPLELAKKIAFQLKDNEYKLCSVITDKRGRVLSIGVNSYKKTHPFMAQAAKKYGCAEKQYLHSEIASLIACKSKPYAIYTARINRKGESQNAKPCEICEAVLKESNIKKIYYT
jgi:deoxycytidylate deaminase